MAGKRKRKSRLVKLVSGASSTLKRFRRRYMRAGKKATSSTREEGIEVKMVRGPDDKRTAIDESKEGPVQGIFIGTKKAVPEDTEADAADTQNENHKWWKDPHFTVPTAIGFSSIIVSVILWLLR